MADIYEQHDKAFANVSAFVILKGGERVATVTIKLPRDGAGRLWAYTHWLGVQMTRHHASGYGYDKRTPAVCGGFLKACPDKPAADASEWDKSVYQQKADALLAFKQALDPHSGEDWTRQIEKAGYRVLQAV